MRVLLIKTSSMGDIVHNLPVVADLRRALPDVVIDWVVEEAYVDLVGMVRGIDRIIPVALRRWRRTPHHRATHDERRAFGHALRAERYDIVLDTQGLLKSALIGRRARLTPDGLRTGFSFGLVREPLARLFYDRGHAVDRRLHAIERMRALAAQVFGYADQEPGSPRFELDVPQQRFDWIPQVDGRSLPYVVLLHATARAEKSWPQERWAGLVRLVSQAGLVPILPSGNENERIAAEAILGAARALADGAVEGLVAPPLTLAACARLLGDARAVVGVDTGLLHVAAALDVPTVGLFGATPRWRYAPYWSSRAINLGSFGELGAQPPLDAVVDSLKQLGVLAPPVLKAPTRTLGERVASWAYSGLWIVATPLIAGYLLWRSRRQPAYRHGWSERFLGRGRSQATRPTLWIHAVSVGETRAAGPLIEALLVAHPACDILVTHMTPTGRETAEALFGDRVRHAYLAYDYPHAVASFLRRWRPVVGIVMETEIWPNLMRAAARAGVPMVLANARLSAKSMTAASRWRALMRPAMRSFTRILAQTDADAKRFAILAESEREADSTIVTIGNVKFDAELPDRQRELARVFRGWFETERPTPRLLLCASTREGEEEQIVDAWLRHAAHDDAAALDGRVVLVIVPRHPQRFDEIVTMVRARGLTVARRSDDRAPPPGTRVWIGDSMGELPAYYLAADLAYVGGSVVPLGGQNLIEAAAAGCPVLVGRHTFNFAAASDEAVRVGAALRVADYDMLVVTGLALAHDAARRTQMRDAGLAFAAGHRGATARTVAVIDALIGPAKAPS